jgi:cell division septal protein FtsQ
MNAEIPRFLPERLRPPTAGRKRRRGYALLTVVPVMLLALPRWQVSEVRVEGCPNLPAASVHSLHELVGQPALGLDLEAVRDRIQIWPGVGEVEVELELPGTVHVRAAAAPCLGSLQVGRSWHGVAADGSLTGILDIALPPVLAGFGSDLERSTGLAVARRLEAATGGQVKEIRRVTPFDYRLRLQPSDGGPERVVYVLPQGTDAESAWCAAVAKGSLTQTWADLRMTDRIVLGGGS